MRNNICYDAKKCTGCSACVNVCPQRCITMCADKEGFLYPVIHSEKCVDCKLCERTCPVNNPPEVYPVLESYIVRNNDMSIVDNSTSGGTSAAFAKYVFDCNGIIYGVGYDSNLIVRHIEIDKTQPDRVKKIRGSKYVQSDLAHSFSEIKKYLKQNRLVCFMGTPCQVSGLINYLQKDYNNLITVDLVCHGVSSPLFFQKYILFMEKRYSAKINDIRFRNKTYGYHSGTMMLSFDNDQKYYGSGRIDYMLKAYFKGACSRESCYVCPFKGVDRCSDFTVFDSWNVSKIISDINDDDRGYTNLYVHTEKGKSIIEKLRESLIMLPANSGLMHKYDGAMIDKQPTRFSYRDQILSSMINDEFSKVMKKYLHITLKDYLIEYSKKMVYKFGIFKFLKKEKC